MNDPAPPATHNDGAIRIERHPGGADGAVELRVAGRLDLAHANTFVRELRRALDSVSGRARVDLAGIESLDGAGASLLLHVLHEHAGRVELAGAPADVRAVLDLYRGADAREPLRAPPEHVGVATQVGKATFDIAETVSSTLAFIGELFVSTVAALRAPRSIPWHQLMGLIERYGVDSAAIVILINFLMGLVTAFQAGVQMERFGANIFVADAVAISVCRELGPLMAAMILAGRSGAGIAAELGTMKVGEEIDALRTLGLDPHRYLVVPRLLSLLIAVPILTLIADVAGIAGGAFISVTTFDLTLSTYVGRTQAALNIWHVGTGVIKSVAFGLIIGLTACERGLGTRGGAAGVGRSTTSTVVIIIFLLVVFDFLFSLVFQLFGV